MALSHESLVSASLHKSTSHKRTRLQNLVASSPTTDQGQFKNREKPADMDSEEDEDIAAAMGFSSFGGTRKRKFDQTNSPKAKPDASGANSTRLGVRPKIVPDEGNQEPQATNDTTVANTRENEARPQSHPPTSKVKGKQKQQAAGNGERSDFEDAFDWNFTLENCHIFVFSVTGSRHPPGRAPASGSPYN